MRAFPVVLPSGVRYWTVIKDDLGVVPIADHWLRFLRFGRNRSELTTRTHAGSVALYLRWCQATGRSWADAPRDLGLFMLWLKHVPAAEPAAGSSLLAGPGAVPVRGERRVNAVLTAVRGLLSHAVSQGEAPRWVLGQIYELADSRDLPAQAQPEDAGLSYRLRARHRVQEPVIEVDRATDEELVAMFLACRSARDRLTVALLARAGLRRGQVAGLRRGDCHLVTDARALGCDVQGPHLHVRRRDNVNGAWSKSPHAWVLPVDAVVVQAYDQYVDERHARLGAGGSDFLLVNLFRAPVGAPVSPDAIGELFERLCDRSGLDRKVTPHMARRAFGSNVADAGGALDEVQALLGHRHPGSVEAYLTPDVRRLRDAVERAGTPRLAFEPGDGR